MPNGSLKFEWDPKKAASNLRKHSVSFEEAASVFDDLLATVYEDPDHSVHEKRYLTIGTSAKGRLLHIAFADRAARIRIITRERSPETKENSMRKRKDKDSDEMRPEYDLSKLKLSVEESMPSDIDREQTLSCWNQTYERPFPTMNGSTRLCG
jgi:uncharacterized protein